MNYYLGGLAQLARAPALQAGGQRFESVILHSESNGVKSLRLILLILLLCYLSPFFDILTQAKL